MRNTFTIAILAALFLGAGCAKYDRELLGDPAPAQPAVAESEPIPETEDSLGVGMFNELNYYGQWYWVDPYGWAWRPSIVSTWQPFTNGHWIWSQYGWTWISYEPFGWATCHYGYWTTDFTLGWIWIPDYQWSPAQVDWMLWDDYACWAPMPPPGSHWREPWDDPAWVSVPVRRFKEKDIGNYRTAPKYKAGESDRTLIRTAPDVRTIEKFGPRFDTVDVQLDRRVVGEREFAKIKLPPDQQRIVTDQRTSVKSPNVIQPPVTTLPAPPLNDDGSSTVTRPKTEPQKPKAKTTIKEKKAEERSKSGKDSGKSTGSKEEPKSKKKGK